MQNRPPPLLHQQVKNETLSLLHGVYAGLLLLSSSVFVYLEYQQRSETAMINIIIVMGMVWVLIGLNIVACLKVKRAEGRTLSRMMSVLMLLSFPIGTVLGAIALWKSSNKQWNS
jgi:uncharacterized membrane protein